jgi:hypothetical protein
VHKLLCDYTGEFTHDVPCGEFDSQTKVSCDVRNEQDCKVIEFKITRTLTMRGTDQPAAVVESVVGAKIEYDGTVCTFKNDDVCRLIKGETKEAFKVRVADILINSLKKELNTIVPVGYRRPHSWSGFAKYLLGS